MFINFSLSLMRVIGLSLYMWLLYNSITDVHSFYHCVPIFWKSFLTYFNFEYVLPDIRICATNILNYILLYLKLLISTLPAGVLLLNVRWTLLPNKIMYPKKNHQKVKKASLGWEYPWTSFATMIRRLLENITRNVWMILDNITSLVLP